MGAKRYLSILVRPPLSILIIVSFCGWITMLWDGYSQRLSGHFTSSLENLFDFNIFTSMSWHWLLMLVAMMSPLLTNSINYLWIRSLNRKRWIGIILFLISYFAVWMLAGWILMLFVMSIHLLFREQWYLVPTIEIALAMFWQITPWKQTCLNKCHWTSSISPFGIPFILNCLGYGIVNGFWCVGSCLSLMVLPLTIPQTSISFVVMLAITIIITAERYQPTHSIMWRIPKFKFN